jgi:hypothetical protein
MIKRICDICHKGEATNQYKIKKLEEVCEFDDHGVFPKKMWVDIDICTSCLIDICQGKSREKNGVSV